jgi:hypothetical protein
LPDNFNDLLSAAIATPSAWKLGVQISMRKLWSVAVAFLAGLCGCGPSGPTPSNSPANPGLSASFNVGMRDRLLARIGDINDFSRPRPLVTLEEFFEGNNDAGSIGYNLPDPPQPEEFYKLLLEIRKRPGVSDIRIEVMDREDAEGWPSSNTIWIITTVSSQEVRTWFPKRLAPSEIINGFEAAPSPVEKYSVPQGMHAVGLWYH